MLQTRSVDIDWAIKCARATTVPENVEGCEMTSKMHVRYPTLFRVAKTDHISPLHFRGGSLSSVFTNGRNVKILLSYKCRRGDSLFVRIVALALALSKGVAANLHTIQSLHE